MRTYQSFLLLLLIFEIVHSLPVGDMANTKKVVYPRAPPKTVRPVAAPKQKPKAIPKPKPKPKVVTPVKKPNTTKTGATVQAKTKTVSGKGTTTTKATTKAPIKGKTTTTSPVKGKTSTVTKSKTPGKTNTPAKAKTSKAPVKGTSAAVPPGKNAKLSCPAKSTKAAKGSKAVKKTRELIDGFMSLFRRDTEFVGYHGTNGENAQAYLAASSEGRIPIPPAFNGADGELSGLGIYVADDIVTARTFATGSAGSRNAKGQTANAANVPFICIVEANDRASWRRNVHKVWITFTQIATLTGGVNDPQKLRQQEETIRCNQGDPANTVRFSVLNHNDPNNRRIGNQMMIPTTLFAQFKISRCAPLSTSQINSLPGDFGVPDFPAFNYFNLRGPNDWNILGNAP